jgi:hypothetical protein
MFVNNISRSSEKCSPCYVYCYGSELSIFVTFFKFICQPLKVPVLTFLQVGREPCGYEENLLVSHLHGHHTANLWVHQRPGTRYILPFSCRYLAPSPPLSRTCLHTVLREIRRIKREVRKVVTVVGSVADPY